MKGSVLAGILLGSVALFAATIVGFFLAGLTNTEWVFLAVLCPGVTQLLWVIPLVLMFRRKQKPETVKGLVIVAGIVALFNAACWGMMANVRIAG